MQENQAAKAAAWYLREQTIEWSVSAGAPIGHPALYEAYKDLWQSQAGKYYCRRTLLHKDDSSMEWGVLIVS